MAYLVRIIYQGHARILSIKTPTASRDRLKLAALKYEMKPPKQCLNYRPQCPRAGQAIDLDAAISAVHQAVEATPADHPDRADRLSNRGSALLRRFQRTGRAADLDAAACAVPKLVRSR